MSDPTDNGAPNILVYATDSAAVEDVCTTLHEAGFAVVFINSAPLPGKLYGFRYLISLAAAKPVTVQRFASVLDSGVLRLGWFQAAR